MADKVRRTGLDELAGITKKSRPVRAASGRRQAVAASGAGFAGVRKAGRAYRDFRKNEWTDMDGIPLEIYDSLIELDGLIDRMESYGAEDGFGEDANYNECYFDAMRAGDLVSGINYRLNRMIAGEKRSGEKDPRRAKQIDRLYGLTGVLEDNLKTLKDSLEREYGFGARSADKGMAMGMNSGVLKPGAEDN